MAKLGIIADDLSGACDSAAEFASRNFSAIVDLRGSLEDSEQADVLAISTETRTESPAKASAKVVEIFERMRQAGIRSIYKKIDSGLRGNCRAEIDALLSAAELERAFILPAFPETHRHVRSGSLYINDEPSSALHIPTVLGGRDLQCITVDDCRSDRAVGKGLFVVDTSSREELRQAAQLLWKRVPGTLLVGSAGLAAEIAELMRKDTDVSKTVTILPFPSSVKSLIFVVGSSHVQTGAQIDFLKHCRKIECMELAACWDLSARQMLVENKDVVLVLDCNCFDLSLLRELRNLVADGLCSALIATGGYTARMVCDSLDARAIRIYRNLLPGMALGALIGPDVDGLPVVTKSGGFGAADALARIAYLLREEKVA